MSGPLAGLVRFFHRRERDLLDSLARAAAVWAPATRRRLGRFVAVIARDLLRIRWRYVTATLRDRLGLPPDRAVSLARRVYDSFFENAVEMASLPYLPADELLARVRVEGRANLEAALARQKGIILISGHYGLWEMIPPWLCRNGLAVTAVARPQKNVPVDEWMGFMRRAHGVGITDSGFSLRESLRTLRQGRMLGLMSDLDAGDRGIFVDFFGRPAATVVGPAVISKKTKAPILPMAMHPGRPPGQCFGWTRPPHTLEICPPILPEDFPDSETGRQALTQAFTAVLERWIRARPDQWFWLHRRWKTRPPGEPR